MKKSVLYWLGVGLCWALLASVDCQANDIEKKFIEAGLINIHAVDASIKVDLVNADPAKNYFRQDFYKGLTHAYLRKPVAGKLAAAQKILKSRFPDYSLLVMDAARPRSVSRLMYAKMKGTRFENFVAHPDKGSMHNYGIAVDVTLAGPDGQSLDMGFTPFYKGDFSIYLGYAKNKMFGLSTAQKKNRALLADVMKKAGFIPLGHEWWHFNGMPKDEARKKYKLIE